jgi:vitamin K-dependent gamma-carboxylase
MPPRADTRRPEFRVAPGEGTLAPPMLAGSSSRPSLDVAGLVVLRVFAGVGVVLFAVALFQGWGPLAGFFDAPKHFPYRGLEWVRPLSPRGLRAAAAVMGLAGAAMAAGFRYRLAGAASALLVAYLFFLDVLYYDVVTFLGILLLVLLAASPAHVVASVDAARRAVPCRGLRTSVMLLRFQVGAVYAFAGIAKLTRGWLSGGTLRAMMTGYPPARWLAPVVAPRSVLIAISWLGLLFDLAIVPLLLWRRTRTAALVALVLFHLHNALAMNLGAVPWLMLGASTVFLPTDWPRRLGLRLPPTPPCSADPAWMRPAAALWVVLGLAWPLRRWVTPGDPAFHGFGYDFTWALRSRARDCGAYLVVVDRATSQSSFRSIEPGLRPDLRGRVWCDAYSIWRSAQDAGRDGNVEVHATAFTSLDAHRPSPMIDPAADLAREPFPLLGVPRWVLLREHP